MYCFFWRAEFRRSFDTISCPTLIKKTPWNICHFEVSWKNTILGMHVVVVPMGSLFGMLSTRITMPRVSCENIEYQNTKQEGFNRWIEESTKETFFCDLRIHLFIFAEFINPTFFRGAISCFVTFPYIHHPSTCHLTTSPLKDFESHIWIGKVVFQAWLLRGFVMLVSGYLMFFFHLPSSFQLPQLNYSNRKKNMDWKSPFFFLGGITMEIG